MIIATLELVVAFKEKAKMIFLQRGEKTHLLRECPVQGEEYAAMDGEYLECEK